VNAICAAVCLVLALSAVPPAAAQPAPSRGAETTATKPIPYRKDESFGDLATNVGFGLIVAIGVGVGALYLLRRYLVTMQKSPGRRLRVIESVRLGPKSALFLVELDGRGLLVGQQGDTLAVLAHPDASTNHGASADRSRTSLTRSSADDHAA
jgi:flagellar biogenesis protein FliO